MDIKRVLKARGVSAKDVAEKMGITAIGLSQHINGNPSVQVLERIAEAVGCEVGDFFERSDDFTAFVRHKGNTYTFDSSDALKEFANTL
ncbi:MAG: helix-turn-helix transcriptional regulator [Alistipes sp.]|nr:helix-turn-helix transcriptional regulator [Alistipes sp.]